VVSCDASGLVGEWQNHFKMVSHPENAQARQTFEHANMSG
jgi:hypothetical protein